MADVVQGHMERMVPELDLLMKNSLISETEGNAIVKQRKQFEYALVSSNVALSDYLRYIQYELDLEKLQGIRMKKLNFTSKKRQILSKTCGIQRVYGLYRRALRKYGKNVDLWLQYINLCLSKRSFKTLGSAFAEAIKQHPLNATLWIRAAFFEYEENHNIHAARVLMQRALRILKEDKELWLQYVRLELLYRKKLSDRLKIMGVDEKTLIKESDNQVDLGDDQDGEVEKDADLDQMQNETDAVDKEKANGKNNPFFEGQIASIIFQTACTQFPDDFEFVMEFWEIFREFPDTENLQEMLYQHIRDNITLSSNVRGFLATIPLLSCSSVEYSEEFLTKYRESVELFEQNISELTTCSMYHEYSSLLHRLLSRCIDEQCIQVLVDSLSKLFEDAQENDCLSEELFAEWNRFLLSIGEFDRAQELSILGQTEHKQSLPMLKLRFQSEIMYFMKKNKHVSKKSKETFCSTLSSLLAGALDEAKDELELFDVWILLKNYFSVSSSEYGTVLKYLKKLLIRNPRDIHIIKEDALRFVVFQFGVDEARDCFKESRQFPPTKIALYEQMIEIELSQPSANMTTVRKLFDQSTIEKSAQNHPELFVHFLQHELQNKNFEKIQAIYWKAKKTLKNFEEFEKMYELLTK